MYKVYADNELIYSPELEESDRIIFSPSLTREIGKADSFQFGLPFSNVYYYKLTPYATKIIVTRDEKEVFRGRVLDISRDFDNVKTVTCEGSLSYLLDSVIKNEDYKGTTRGFFKLIVAKHNASVQEEYKQFDVGEITIDDREFEVRGQKKNDKRDDGIHSFEQILINATAEERKNAFEYISSCLISYVGGYLRVRRVDGRNVLDLLKDNYGKKASQTLEYGVNLLDITQEFKASDLFTVLIPLGDENLTIEKVNGGSEELVNEELVAKYGRVVKTNVFSNVTDPAKLLQNGQAYMERHCKIPRTITIRAIDLHNVDSTVESFDVGDSVHIKSELHEIDEDVVCSKITQDLSDPANDEYSFGDQEQDLTDIFLEDKKKSGGKGKAADPDQVIEDYFNVYVNAGKEQGSFDLVAQYKKVDKTKSTLDKMIYVLEHQLGLKLDAGEGRIDLTNMRNQLDEAGKAIVSSTSAIHLLQDDIQTMKTQIEMTSVTTGLLDKAQVDHWAQYLQETDANRAKISLLVGNTENNAKGITLVSKMVDGHEQTITEINTDVVWMKQAILEVRQLVTEGLVADWIHSGTISGVKMAKLGKATFAPNSMKIEELSEFHEDAYFFEDLNVSGNLTVSYNKVATQAWVQEQGYATQQYVLDQKYYNNFVPWTKISSKPTFTVKEVVINGIGYRMWTNQP